MRLKVINWTKDVLFLLMGALSAAFGLESFLLPNRFIDGGVTGVSLLITEVTYLPLSWLIVIVNLPFLILGYRVISFNFMIKSAISIGILSILLATITFPEVTKDEVLVAVFGGFFLGAGIGLSIRGGGVLDGTEVLAIFLSRKLGLKIGDLIIIINVFIFLAAAYFLSIESALYSMLTYLAASRTLDFVIDGIEEYTGVTIISQKHEEIADMISEKLGRGLTALQATRGYGKNGVKYQFEVLYTVITRLEVRKLNVEIARIDPEAFVIMNSLNDTRGGMIKKKSL